MVVVLLEVFGVGTLSYGLATMAEYSVSGQPSGLRQARRSERMIDFSSDHVIVGGFGRVGRQVSRDLRQAAIDHLASRRPDGEIEAQSEAPVGSCA